MNYKYPLGRYCLAAVLCPNPDHPRWKDAEFIGDEIHREIYTSRLYRTKAGAQRALEGNWGDLVSGSAGIDCGNYPELAGMYVDDVEVVVV
jgi:hypothetical protein